MRQSTTISKEILERAVGQLDKTSSSEVPRGVADWCRRNAKKVGASLFTVGTLVSVGTYMHQVQKSEAQERREVQREVLDWLEADIAEVRDLLREIGTSYEGVRRRATEVSAAMHYRDFRRVATGYDELHTALRDWERMGRSKGRLVRAVTGCQRTSASQAMTAERWLAAERVLAGWDGAAAHYASLAPTTDATPFVFADQLVRDAVEGVGGMIKGEHCADRYLWRQRRAHDTSMWHEAANDPDIATPDFVSVLEVFSFVDYTTDISRNVDVESCQGNEQRARDDLALWREHSEFRPFIGTDGPGSELADVGEMTGGVPRGCDPNERLTHADMCEVVYHEQMDGVAGVSQARFEAANMYVMLGLTLIDEMAPIYLREKCRERAMGRPDPSGGSGLDPSFCDEPGSIRWVVRHRLPPDPANGVSPADAPVDHEDSEAIPMVLAGDGIDAAAITGSVD